MQTSGNTRRSHKPCNNPEVLGLSSGSLNELQRQDLIHSPHLLLELMTMMIYTASAWNVHSNAVMLPSSVAI